MHITERLERENGRDYAMRILKDNIIRMEMEPGSVISDRDVAAQLGLSRTPVREALLDLAKVRIIEIYPQKGSSVSLVDYSLVEEARFVRSVLENAVVEVVCSVITPEQLKQLEDHVKLQRFYQAQDDHEKLGQLDDEFHRMLFQIAQKMQAYEMMQSLTIHFDRVRNMSLNTVKEQKWVDDHEKIFEAIRDNDPQLAHSLMDKHLRRYKIDEQAIREQYPQYFKNVE
jgi:DNA-binding GntR family transcriptional regulator